MDMRFGTWNVRVCTGQVPGKQYQEKQKTMPLLVEVREVRWDNSSSEQQTISYEFFYGNGNADYHLGTDFVLHKEIISAVKRVEFVSGRIAYTILRVCWCDIVLSMHAPTEDKFYDTKDSFYEELERVFDQFPK
jgi:hypothetical protein